MAKASSSKWKQENYNKNVKVSQSTINAMKGKTKAQNIASAKTAEQKEAVRRFYGKSAAPAATSTAREKAATLPRKSVVGVKPNKTNSTGSSSSKSSGSSKPGMGLRASESTKKTMGNIAGVGSSNATGTSIGNQIAAGKKLKDAGKTMTKAQQKAAWDKKSKAEKALSVAPQMLLPMGGAVKGGVMGVRALGNAARIRAAVPGTAASIKTAKAAATRAANKKAAENLAKKKAAEAAAKKAAPKPKPKASKPATKKTAPKRTPSAKKN